jgi:hypothetical protein
LALPKRLEPSTLDTDSCTCSCTPALDEAILTLRIFLPHRSPWVREIAEKGLARIEKLMGKEFVEGSNTRQADRHRAAQPAPNK